MSTWLYMLMCIALKIGNSTVPPSTMMTGTR